MSRIDASLATQLADNVRPVQTSRDQQLQVQQAAVADFKQDGADADTPDSANPAQIRNAAAQLKQVVEAASGRQLSFDMDEQSKELVVKVTDTQTGMVIRQIPSKEVLDLQDRLDSLVGVIFNRNA